jgi:hypothetical protein
LVLADDQAGKPDGPCRKSSSGPGQNLNRNRWQKTVTGEYRKFS